MSLVDYSSSSSGSPSPPAKKIKASQSSLPALPADFYDLYASNVRTSNVDDPSLHAGRERGSEHRIGAWPSHIYLEWICTEEFKLLSSLVTSISDSETQSLLVNDLDVPLPLHISLSAPLMLENDSKDAFLNGVSRKIDQAGVERFAISFANLQWEPNSDRSRWFLVLRVCRPKENELNRLLVACNAIARQYNVPQLYATTSGFFHVSIAWRLAKPSLDNEKLLANAEKELREIEKLTVPLTAVKVKIGNKVTAVGLRANTPKKS